MHAFTRTAWVPAKSTRQPHCRSASEPAGFASPTSAATKGHSEASVHSMHACCPRLSLPAAGPCAWWRRGLAPTERMRCARCAVEART